MITRIPPCLFRFCTALAFGLALVLLPFAHRTTAAVADPALEAFLAMGGTAADICGGGEHAVTARGCEACRLTASLYLPSTPDNVAPFEGRIGAVASSPVWTLVAGCRRGPVPPARAPPSL